MDEVIRIVHISDLHLAEALHTPSRPKRHAKHRHGHNIVAFHALNQCLNEHDYDVLVVTGDITRVGAKDSFVHACDWLRHGPRTGQVGLDLDARDIPLVTVPGNHDRFGAQLIQNRGGLEDYYKYFDPIQAGKAKLIRIPRLGADIAFHCFDSSVRDGAFSYGQVPTDDLKAPSIPEGIAAKIAVMHHHVMVPPGARHIKKSLRLRNAPQVLTWLLGQGYDMIMCGHTHHSFFDVIPGSTALKVVNAMHGRSGKAPRRSMLRSRILESLFDQMQTDPGPIRKCPCKNGHMPGTDDYYDYLYFKIVKGEKVPEPEDVRTPEILRKMVEEMAKNGGRPSVQDLQRKGRIAYSMAPSACQAEVKESLLGFHEINLIMDLRGQNPVLSDIQSITWMFDGGVFSPSPDSGQHLPRRRPKAKLSTDAQEQHVPHGG